MRKINSLYQALVITACSIVISACSQEEPASNDDFEQQVQDYIQKVPYHETFDYAMQLTGGDPLKLNQWGQASRNLLKAGEDSIVRVNNDTLYKTAFVYLGDGPVVLRSNSPSKERFSSFQLQDERNANYRNIISPNGSYTLYHGEKPATITGEAVEVPSLLSAVVTRIEVKDPSDALDMAAAQTVFDGITIEGPTIRQLPVVDLLSGFDEQVAREANRRMDETARSVPFSEMIVGPGQEPGKDVPYLYHSAGSKVGWGGPATSHSAYDSMFTDASGAALDGSKGEYVLVTAAPPVNAFWSVTAYDSTAGRLHPNADNRYHFNNTTAVSNEDGTYTFRFKVRCEDGDVNCLEVPAGPFDVAARYYLPEPEIMSGQWMMPKPVLQKSE